MHKKIKSITSLAISATLITLASQSAGVTQESRIERPASITQLVESRGTGIFNIISQGERIGSLTLTCRWSWFGLGGPEAIAVVSTPTLSSRGETMLSGTATFSSISDQTAATVPARRSSVFGPATLEHQAYLPDGTESLRMQSHSFTTVKNIGGRPIQTIYRFGSRPEGPNCPLRP